MEAGEPRPHARGAAILGSLPYFGLVGMAGVFAAVVLGFEEPNASILLVSGLLMLMAPLAAAVHLTFTSEMTREEKRLWVRIFSSPRAFGAFSPYLTSLDRGATARKITAQDSK